MGEDGNASCDIDFVVYAPECFALKSQDDLDYSYHVIPMICIDACRCCRLYDHVCLYKQEVNFEDRIEGIDVAWTTPSVVKSQ